MAEAKIVERQKITINKVEYYMDSLDEQSQKILGDIRVIDSEMQRLQVSLSISGVAKNSLLEKLEANSADFSKVPIKESGGDCEGDGKTEATENTRRLTEGDEGWEPEPGII